MPKQQVKQKRIPRLVGFDCFAQALYNGIGFDGICARIVWRSAFFFAPAVDQMQQAKSDCSVWTEFHRHFLMSPFLFVLAIDQVQHAEQFVPSRLVDFNCIV